MCHHFFLVKSFYLANDSCYMILTSNDSDNKTDNNMHNHFDNNFRKKCFNIIYLLSTIFQWLVYMLLRNYSYFKIFASLFIVLLIYSSTHLLIYFHILFLNYFRTLVIQYGTMRRFGKTQKSDKLRHFLHDLYHMGYIFLGNIYQWPKRKKKKLYRFSQNSYAPLR